MAQLPVVYSHQSATGTGVGLAIDILNLTNPWFPPPMEVWVIGTSATVKIEGSMDNQTWLDYSSGGFAITPGAGSIVKDLISGIRYWRTNIVSVNGAVSSRVGANQTESGRPVSPNNPSQFFSGDPSL